MTTKWMAENILRNYSSKSDAIRQLHAEGYQPNKIADLLQIRVQMVHNVLGAIKTTTPSVVPTTPSIVKPKPYRH